MMTCGAWQPCTACRPINPAHATGALGKDSLLPTIVTPSDVRALKTRLTPFVQALDETAKACADKLPKNIADGWNSFVTAWASYAAASESWLSTRAEMNQGESYEEDLGNWQTAIAKYCGGTVATPPAPSTGPETGPSSALQDTIKTVAICAAVGLGAWALHSAVKS